VGRYFEGIVDHADSLAIERCVQIITTTDFSEKLRKLGEETNLPIVCVHGDKDSGCPVEASAVVVKKIIPRTVLKIYQNGSHGE
jgi:pimeloyl-ACP methyl ester carboxylesterase